MQQREGPVALKRDIKGIVAGMEGIGAGIRDIVVVMRAICGT